MKIHTHYVPQYYLKGFSDDSVNICRYNKDDGKCIHIPVKCAAQEKDLYSQEVEIKLANEIENPGNEVIKKIRDKESLSSMDKIVFAKYMVAMFKRVPKGLEFAAKRFPEGIKIIENSAQTKSEKDIIKQIEKEGVRDIWLQTIPDVTNAKLMNVISNEMRWIFFCIQDESNFLTSDSPLIINANTHELSFPISSKIALCLTWNNRLVEGYHPSKKQITNEFNRRTVRESMNYIFNCKEEGWIEPFILNKNWK